MELSNGEQPPIYPSFTLKTDARSYIVNKSDYKKTKIIKYVRSSKSDQFSSVIPPLKTERRSLIESILSISGQKQKKSYQLKWAFLRL